MNSQLTSLPMCGFIAQLVEHRTCIAEIMGSNPVEALIFFRLLYSNCLNWKFTAKITYHLHIYPQLIYESLTAWPWAERGSCFTRDLLFFFGFFLSVTRLKPQLGQIVIMTFNHATCDVYSPKAVKTLMLWILFSFFCRKYIFFWFIEALDPNLRLNTLKKVLRQPWNALMLQVSLSLRDR